MPAQWTKVDPPLGIWVNWPWGSEAEAASSFAVGSELWGAGDGSPQIWIEANELADRQAEEAAVRFQLHPDRISNVQAVESKAARARKRVCTVLECVTQS